VFPARVSREFPLRVQLILTRENLLNPITITILSPLKSSLTMNRWVEVGAHVLPAGSASAGPLKDERELAGCMRPRSLYRIAEMRGA
jgi:hypothetical protein